MVFCRFLDLGAVSVPEEVIFRNSSARRIAVPVGAVLLEADTRCILFDTGFGDGSLDPGMPWYGTQDQTLERQLARYGHTPQDVDTVILSHCHSDHAGGADLFPHARFLLPKDGGVFSLVPPSAPVQEIPIDGDFDLTGEIRVLTLPGHATNLLGLLVHTAEGLLLLPSDAVYTPLSYGPPVRLPGSCADDQAYLASVEKLRRLQAQTGAEIRFPHWPILDIKENDR